MVYNDIYFTKKYGELCEIIDGGKLVVFDFKSDDGYIRNMFIKREIPIIVDDEKYYDIITPYGYGGPMIIDCQDKSKKDKLVKEYFYKLKDYCMENKIVSEFIRFHPINNNAADFEKIYDVEYKRKTVGTNLKIYDDPVENEFSKDSRRRINKSLKEGVTYEVIKNVDNLDAFKELYYHTMKRNNADAFYYFDCQYFDAVIRDFKKELVMVNVLFKDKIIASEMCFASGGLIHSHLATSLNDYFYLSPGHVSVNAIVRWGKENGYDYMHYGGGRTNDDDDNLLRFKKNFGKHTKFNFYVGKKIWNEEKYFEMCDVKNVNVDNDFFPAYRNK